MCIVALTRPESTPLFLGDCSDSMTQSNIVHLQFFSVVIANRNHHVQGLTAASATSELLTMST